MPDGSRLWEKGVSTRVFKAYEILSEYRKLGALPWPLLVDDTLSLHKEGAREYEVATHAAAPAFADTLTTPLVHELGPHNAHIPASELTQTLGKSF